MTKFLTLAAGALALAAITAEPARATGFHHGPSAGNVVQVTYGHQTSIRRILWNLRQRGFHDFRDIDRWGRVYKITARGYRGNLVRITVNAYNGRVIDVDPIRYHHNGWGGGQGGYGGHSWSWTLRF